jgi:hypothetical protein
VIRLALERRNHHDEHLHQMVIGRRARALQHEHIMPAHVLVDFHEGFTVGKGADGALPQGHLDGLADCLRKLRIGVAREYLHGR